MLLLPRLRDRCVTLLRRRVPSTTSSQAAPRPSCGDAVIHAALQSTAFICGLVVVVAIIYAAQSPHWVVMDDPSSPGCDDVHVSVEAAPPRRTSADGRRTSDERAGGVTVATSGLALMDQRGRCTTGHTYVGPWTVCENQLGSCENVANSVDALLWFATAMSGTALQLMLVKLLLSFTSYNLLRHQQLVIGVGAACFHAAAGLAVLVAMFIYAASISDRLGPYATTSNYHYGRGFLAVVVSFLSANVAAVTAAYASTRHQRLNGTLAQSQKA